MKRIGIFLIAALALSSCQNESDGAEGVQEIRSSPMDNAAIIRNPINADGTLDTVNVAKMIFEEREFDFGEVQQGDVLEHVFTFTNEGKAPLLITSAKSTCGCTVPDWPKNPIAPGKKGQISVKFNTENKARQQRKPITITANTYPKKTEIYLKAFVHTPESE